MISAKVAKKETLKVINEKEFMIKNTINKYQRLVRHIEERIITDINRGQYKTSLGSINDDGNGIRGIGYYLSYDAFDALRLIFGNLGYTFKEETDPIMMKYICWD